MNFEEWAAKPLLAEVGIATPKSYVVQSPGRAEQAFGLINGACVIKAQVPTGGRGKAGGIKLANSGAAAFNHAERIMAMTIGGHEVSRLLVEQRVPFTHELYAAIVNDPASRGPLLLFSTKGGMDVEDIVAKHPATLVRLPLDIRKGLDKAALDAALPAKLPCDRQRLIDLFDRLWVAYARHDAELLEINPLVVAGSGVLVALDCKFVMDDSAVPRHAELAKKGAPEPTSDLEARAATLALKFIELEGEVGVLANGAGLTMTTMDAVRHYGGRPANFMEIGGESYTKAKPALELVLANPRVKALLVNFCGAFARTDVMADGVTKAWAELKPKIPIVFTIHGTGEDEAIAMVRERLGIEPHDLMDDAVQAAVAAARGG